MLEIKSIDVYYDKFQALFDLNMRIGEQETVITVGPNGAGKSTLLKAISGLQPVKRGKITFMGQSIEKFSTHKIVGMGLVYVPESGRVFPNLTVIENLKVGSYAERARAHFKPSLEEVFNLFPRLAEREKQIAETLSGGERQMLAVARSLMARPKLILLDEPSMGLAPLIVSQLFEFITVIKGRGYSILMVEQNVVKALKLCDRAYLLELGTVKLEGNREMFGKEEYIRQSYLGV
jgi:branched-chain amino acid transport system ATP-binding protein